LSERTRKWSVPRWVAVAVMAAVGCGGSAGASGEIGQTEADAMRQPEVKGPRVLLETSQGNILIGLYPDEAPLTVENFLAYVESGYYDGLIFHRVIPDFMIQSGGHEVDLVMRERTRDPLHNESDNGLSNLRGTIAMARTGDPHSAQAQFFISHVDNPALDYGAGGPDQWGYAVFGRVLEGLDAVDAIASVETGVQGMMQDVPTETVTITRASLVEP
jgi:cyclophilin family peptidyl-prolyl cis-trans isomerase